MTLTLVIQDMAESQSSRSPNRFFTNIYHKGQRNIRSMYMIHTAVLALRISSREVAISLSRAMYTYILYTVHSIHLYRQRGVSAW